MIKNYSLTLLENAINQVLKLDPSLCAKFQKFEGKVIEIIVSPLQINFFITFQGKKMQLLAEHPGVPNTIIESSPIGLIRLSVLPASKARSLFNDSIKISGDVDLGHQVKALFDSMDIDWESHLAHFTGDVAAHQFSSLIKKGLAFKNKITSSMQANLTEYLQEEARFVPGREEVNDFFNDVDALSNDVERLTAQIKLIMAKT